MKYKILCSLFLHICLITNVFSNDDTKFNKLKEIFDVADPILFNQIKGWHTGRCYEDDGYATPQILIATEYHNDNGPLYPSTYHQRVFLALTNGALSSYDQINETDIKNINDFIYRKVWSTSDVSYSQKSLITKRQMNEPNKYMLTEVRKFDDYLVTKRTYLHGTSSTLQDYCYFFKKVY